MNIYKRGKTWTFVVEGPRIKGKRNRITKGGFSTKRECEKEAIALEHQLNVSGSTYRDNKVLFIDLSHNFLNYYKHLVKESTYSTGVRLIRYSNKYFKNYLIKDIKIIDCQNFIQDLLNKSLSPMYIKLIFNKFKQVINYGNDVSEEINYSLNFNKVALPKIRSTVRDDILTDSQIKDILTRYEGSIYYYLFYIAILTGMRKGELLALTWDKIDFDKKHIHVTNTLNTLGKLTSPKNHSSIREIPIYDTLEEILLDLKKYPQKTMSFALDKEKIVPAKENSLDFLFRNKWGSFLSISGLAYKMLNESFHFHQLRHYFATTAINSGVPIAEVSRLLGHAKVSTTMNMYVGINNESNINHKLDTIFGQQMDNKSKINPEN